MRTARGTLILHPQGSPQGNRLTSSRSGQDWSIFCSFGAPLKTFEFRKRNRGLDKRRRAMRPHESGLAALMLLVDEKTKPTCTRIF